MQISVGIIGIKSLVNFGRTVTLNRWRGWKRTLLVMIALLVYLLETQEGFQEESMKTPPLRSLLAVIVCVSATALAQLSDFQTATIVDVETLSPESTPSSGGTDAPVASDVNRYNLSIQLGDSIYVCRVKSSSAYDLNWAKGKEVPAKVKGKLMYVKRADGRVVKLSILKTTKVQ